MAHLQEFGFPHASNIICQMVTEDVPWRQDVVQEGYTILPDGQIVLLNQKPGLGIEINEDEERNHPFEQELVQRAFYSDSAVGDW